MSQPDEDDTSSDSLELDDILPLAMQFHFSGRLVEARKLYEVFLDRLPDHPDALHFFGVLRHQVGESGEGIALIRRAIRLRPEYAAAHNNLGNVLEQTGHLEDAAAAYRAAIELESGDPDAHNNLGVLSRRLGRLDDAVECYEKAIALDPAHAEAIFNLGNARAALGQGDEAIRSYRRLIELQPDRADAHRALGKVLEQTGDREGAIDSYRRAGTLCSDRAEAQFDLGNALALEVGLEAAVEAYAKTIALAPGHVDAHSNLAKILYTLGRFDEAAATWRKLLAIDPEHELAQHMVAAYSGDDVPERASDVYVKATFDEFAHSFDARLEALEYNAPQLVTDALAAEISSPAADLDVLDAGCGTGLCAPLIRPWARSLVGVDLSPRMLDKARERGGYDELAAAELTAWLSAHENAYDLIVSADTFVYFGDLRALLEAAAHALRSPGLLVFTVEDSEGDEPDETGAGFRLHEHGRYSHTDAYVETAAQNASLTLRSSTPVTLRKECGQPVRGRVVVMARAATT